MTEWHIFLGTANLWHLETNDDLVLPNCLTKCFSIWERKTPRLPDLSEVFDVFNNVGWKGKIALRRNLIKLFVLALLLPSMRSTRNVLPYRPISVHWMQAPHSHHCLIILQQSPKGKAHISCWEGWAPLCRSLAAHLGSFGLKMNKRRHWARSLPILLMQMVHHFQPWKGAH